MKSGAMFGALSKYKDEEFFRNNDLITVFDGEYLKNSSSLYSDVRDIQESNNIFILRFDIEKIYRHIVHQVFIRTDFPSVSAYVVFVLFFKAAL